MKLDILSLIYIGYFMHMSNADGHGKEVHFKIHVPELTHKHSHKHTIYKKSPVRFDGKYEGEYQTARGGEKDNILVKEYTHPQENEHGYKYENKPYQKHTAKQKQGKKNKHKQENKEDDEDFSKYLNNFEVKPDKLNDQTDFDVGPVFKKTGKSVHTEHYEVKKINPDAKYPDEKYIIKGSYKVQETDPFFDFTTTAVHAYDDPISKIAAKILTNYDYTTFDPYSSGKESENFSEKEEERNGPAHENYDGNNYSNNADSYDKYGAKKEKVRDYSRNYPNHENYDNNDAEKIYEYSNGSPSHDKYGNKDAKKPKVNNHNNGYPSHEKYDNNDGKKEKVNVYNVVYPGHAKYIDYGKQIGQDYSNTNPSYGTYVNNDKKATKENVRDHGGAYPSHGKFVDYDGNKEVDSYAAVHPNTGKFKDYNIKNGETSEYNAHPNHGKLILSEPNNNNYGSKVISYYTSPTYSEVETSAPFDYIGHPSYEHLKLADSHYDYYGGKELDYFVDPNHRDNLYDNDWQEHIIRTVYGNDYAASDKIASAVLPEQAEGPK